MSNYDDLIPASNSTPSTPQGNYDDLVPSDQPSTAMSTIRGFGNGFTGGLSKYGGAGVMYGLSLLDPTVHANWQDALDTVNEQRNEDRTVHPEAYQVGNLAGAGTMGYLTGGTSLLRNTAVGAVTGATNAVSESDNVNDALPGAAVGATISGTLGTLGKGVQWAAGKSSMANMATDLASTGGSGSGGGSGVLAQLGLQGLKAVGGGTLGAGIDYSANHVFGKGDKTFSDSMSSLPAEVGAMYGGYNGAGGLPGAINQATKSAVSKIARTGISGQTAGAIGQPIVNQVAPNNTGLKAVIQDLMNKQPNNNPPIQVEDNGTGYTPI